MSKEQGIIPKDQIPRAVQELLENYFWLPTIKTMQVYRRLHDDHNGTNTGEICVMFYPDGDARVWIEGGRPTDSLRFRMTGLGGGLSQRTRVALLILAEAIRLDNEECPL